MLSFIFISQLSFTWQFDHKYRPEGPHSARENKETTGKWLFSGYMLNFYNFFDDTDALVHSFIISNL